MRWKNYDPLVIEHKALAMLRLQELVRVGYHYWTEGALAPGSLKAFLMRFRDTYQVHLDRNARHRRKREGFGNAELVLWRPEGAAKVHFWLLVSDGEHAARKLERLRDAREGGNRIVIDNYELLRLPRKGQAAASWTWRLTDEGVAGWEARLSKAIELVGRNDTELKQAFHSLYKSPGFSGVRKQVGHLVSYARGQWNRKRRANDRFPVVFPHGVPFTGTPPAELRAAGLRNDERGWHTLGFPAREVLPHLFYLRRMPIVGTPASALIKEAKQGSPEGKIAHSQ